MKRSYWWVCGAVIITGVYMTIYGVVQQDLRQSANDPQIQLAEDTARQIVTTGQTDVAPAGFVNLADGSLAPFVMVFDKNLNVVSRNADYDDPTRHHEVVTPPSGVFGHTNHGALDLLTWQDKYGARYASVIAKAGDHYVLAARNMREVEWRERRTFMACLVSWLVSLAILTAGYMVAPRFKNQR